MAQDTSIEWADHTFNPWEGCQKVGPGCDHCYAEARNARYNRGTALNWGPGAPRRRTTPANWRKPLKWAREAEAFKMKTGRRQRVFCSSLADVFDNAVPAKWRRDLFDLIDRTPELDWLLLTNRIGNVQPMLREIDRHYLSDHVWIGATVVNQAEAGRDIPKLLAVEAKVRFLSMEPLLGPVDLDLMARSHGVTARATLLLDWVIVGGESGQGARPMHPAWVTQLEAQCAEAEVPFLFKQWGEWAPWSDDMAHSEYVRHVTPDGIISLHPSPGSAPMIRLGKKHAGRLLDGAEHNGVPHHG